MSEREFEISSKQVIKHTKEGDKSNAPKPQEVLKQIKKQTKESGD